MSPPNTSSGQPRDFKGRVVLITGAGSGVGLECARVFAVQGAKLLLVGRSADKLESAVATLAEEISTIRDIGERVFGEGP